MSEKDIIKYVSIGGGILVLGLITYMFKSKADNVLGENTTYGSAIDVMRNPDKYKSTKDSDSSEEEEYDDVPSGSIEESDEPDDEFDSNEESSIYKDAGDLLKFGGSRKHNAKKSKRKHNKSKDNAKKSKRKHNNKKSKCKNNNKHNKSKCKNNTKHNKSNKK
jgi:hypothetical protein